MSMNAPFRSHLMQQFAAAARGQSRPPLALALLCGDSHQQQPQPRGADRAGRNGRALPLPPSGVPSRPLHEPVGGDGGTGAGTGNSTVLVRHCPGRRSLSTVASSAGGTLDPPPDTTTYATVGATGTNGSSNPPADAPNSLQSFLRSRRTVTNLTPPDPSSYPPNFLRDALSRAVRCAVEAPNHKRTEPFTFTRLASPSSATDALADICYQASVRRMRERQRGSEASLRAEAERKRDRWRGIPAYLVATVGNMPDQVEGWDGDEYSELPFSPPSTERQLEDYAATCAAVQNVLLSLHSEGVGSKWATGPVIRTRAFRDVIRLRDDELVVGLVMVGMPKRVPRSPRRRRVLEGDVLRDI